MKKIIYLLFLLPVLAWSQTDSQNYVRTYTYKDSTRTSDVSKAKASVTYFDGLGRPIQQVAGKMSGTGKDIITHIEYDGFGRQPKGYLPYEAETTDLSYKGAAATEVIGYYTDVTKVQDTAVNPYTEKFFEASPLNRVLKQGAPGAAWKGHTGTNDNDHTVKFAYLANEANNVKKLRAVATWNETNKIYDISFVDDGYYEANLLYKTITQDENKATAISNIEGSGASEKLNTTEEFKDKEGRVILKRTYNKVINRNAVYQTLDTYYVYDQYGNLTYVLSPKAEGSITNTDLIYQYLYDSRNRVVEKYIPGSGWSYIVYDKLDRPVLTQDENNRAAQKWHFTKYDSFSRVAYTGLYLSAGNRATLQVLLNAQNIFNERRVTSLNTIDNTPVYYSNVVEPKTGLTLFTIQYYDNYVYDLPATIAIPSQNHFSRPILQNPKGLSTCSKRRVLETTNWVTEVTGYDSKGRVVWNKKRDDFLNYELTTQPWLDFEGKPLAIFNQINNYNITDHNVYDYYNYDTAGRELRHWHQHQNGGSPFYTSPLELMSYNKYNELGQLVQKKVGRQQQAWSTDYDNTPSLQTVDYTHNIRGWLTGINNITAPGMGNNLFDFKIAYDKPETEGEVAQPLYNGNISETRWRTANDAIQRKYNYQYDNLNRLKEANYVKKIISPVLRTYDEKISYDKNGNIITLQRTGGSEEVAVPMDVLTYTYEQHSNKLLKVSDAQNSPQGFKDVNNLIDYEYDANGNMVIDRNKGITSISYNHLNLPKKISFDTGSYIEYVYDATGTKLQKKVNNAASNTVTITKYKSGFVYENDVLQFMATSEGYLKWTNGNSSYVYQYKDHLGNVRVSYEGRMVNNVITPTIIEEDNYYPFGLKHTGYNTTEAPGTNIAAQKYKYNGKELQDELGLGVYDYGARNYDPALGRWMNIDPLADEYADYSPYAYVFNDPIRHTDPDGMAPDDIVIYGANNSSLTIKTDLIDVSVNAGGLIGDIGGNYTVGGKEILGAALDIVGIFDPTGIADGLNASLQASDGNWGDALISSVGIIPYAGDLAKAGKIEKDVKILDKAIDGAKAINGNSKASTKAQHVYEITEKASDKVVKTGISGGKVSKADKSYRATNQVNKLNKAEGAAKYDSKIVDKIPSGKGARQKALDAEKVNANKNRKTLDPNIHKTP